MSFIDAYCIKCGGDIGGFLTESGDRYVTWPCEKGCLSTDKDAFETDEDFESEEEEGL